LNWVKPYRNPVSHERVARHHEIGVHIMNAFVGQTFQINQLINIHQVVEIVGVARSTVYAMMDEYSPYYDPTFPKKVKITQNRIGWSAYEIHQWIENKLASRE